MVECLNGGNGRQVREMSASQVMGVKALWSPRHSSRWIPEGLGAQAFASSLPLSHKGTMSQDWKSSLSFGFPGGSVIKNLPANAGDTGDMCPIPGSGRSPGGEKWLPAPVFLPGESHEQRSLVGYKPQGHKESDRTESQTPLLGFLLLNLSN